MTLTVLPTPNEFDIRRIEQCDTSVRFRRWLELILVRRLLQRLVEVGYTIEVDDGDERHPRTQHIERLMEDIFAVDECRLYVSGPNLPKSWVFIVLGNDGWDVICDYGTNLNPTISPVDQYAEELSAWV